MNTYVAREDRPAVSEILEAELETRTGDVMGVLTRGHIKVRGWLKRFPPAQPDDSSADEDSPEWKIKPS
jgi:hypothetical protein